MVGVLGIYKILYHLVIHIVILFVISLARIIRFFFFRKAFFDIFPWQFVGNVHLTVIDNTVCVVFTE